MKFVVRYRTSPSATSTRPPEWLDHSIHPASKLGLHNALLAVHDRNEILADRGGFHEAAVFVLRNGVAEQLTQAGAERLFADLPQGEVKWLDLCRCLLPPLAETNGAGADAAEQLPLFHHTHTLYDDLEATRHVLDADA